MAGEEEVMEDFIPRNYQVELMKIALKQNTIIYLPTGAGKTYIAVLVMKQMSRDILRPWSEWGKISIILVNTVALVHQHTKYLERHTSFKVGSYSGDQNVDFWDHQTWEHECNEHNVLIMTCQILTDAVEKSYISLERVNLLVFDECHRGVNDHAMRQLMKSFQHVKEQPRVLGLTATLLNGNYKPHQVSGQVHVLETTYHSQVATVDELDVVIGYSTNPTELIHSYQKYNLTETETTVVNMMIKLKSLVSAIQLERETSPKKPNLTPMGQKSNLSLLCNLIEDLIFHITDLGTFGGIRAIIAHSIQVERLKKNCDEKKLYLILNSVLTEFMLAKNMLEKQLSGDVKTDIFRHSSPKVILLLEIIKGYKQKSSEELCAIIFTQRRFTAKVLYHIVKCLAENFPEHSYIKPNFMVGYNTNPFNDTREALYFTKVNKDIIQKFYLKEINLICSSNILEEGIDVPKCSLVVKFDAPLDYRAYVQSKGRARHKKSLYYIMVERGESCTKFLEKYQMFKSIEDNLTQYLVGQNENRTPPSDGDLTRLYDEYEIPPYYVDGPGSAQVNLVSACALLNQYCSSLPSDNYTAYAPSWYLEKRKGFHECHIRVVIDLPTVCPFIDSIEGPYMKTKKDAKRAAALQACILLHQLGEFDDNLKPARCCEVMEDYDFLFAHWPKEKEPDAGNNKKRRLHSVHVPTVTRGCFTQEQEVHLHLINLTPKFERDKLTDGWAFMSDLYTSLLCFGIVTQNKLPDLCEFPVYVSAGEIAVSIETNVSTFVLSSDEYKLIQKFNHLVYNDILGVLKEYLVFNNFDDEGTPALLLVPVQKDEQRVDFSVISENGCLINKCLEPTSEEKMRIRVSAEEYLAKIVTPWYRQDEADYVVMQVCTDLNAHSSFPTTTHDSYFAYFSSMYQITIANPSQPLLKVKALSPRLNCLKPRGTPNKRNKDLMYEDYEIHFVAEMVVKQTFPSQLWVQAKLIPSIFDKLLQLLRACELRERIAVEADLGVPIPSHKWKALKLDVHLLNWPAEFKEEKEKPFEEAGDGVEQLKMEEITSILNKLNTDVAVKKLNAEFPWDATQEPIDIERNLNVTLMDVQYYENFLKERVRTEERIVHRVVPPHVPAITYDKNFIEKKIAVLEKSCLAGPELAEIFRALATAKCGDVVNLERLETLGDSFLKFVSSLFIFLKYPKADEGAATILKGKLISNRNLYYIAVKKGLEGYIKLNDLKPKSEWSPPGYCLPKALKFSAENGQVNNSTLLNVEIPQEEQTTGELSAETERSILVEMSGAEVFSNECDASLVYFIGKQVISDKVVADVVESLLGAYLESCGIEGGLRLITWLGIIPESESLPQLLRSPPPNPVLNPNATQENIDYHIPSYEEIEERLGYKFKNRAFLLQALTHSSYVPNRVTGCYQRLEFLGDAILDFLITCHIYESCGNLNPGDLTDLRSALVNNITFACYTVRCGFHKFLLAINTKLQSYIDRFLIFQENKDFAVNDDVLILLNEDDMHIAENIDVPKTLGDVFEALAGAVFLDSGMDLKTVWKVFYKIMWKEIELFSNKVPKNAVRVLHEKQGVHPKFHDPVTLDNSKVMMKLDFMIEGSLKRVHGFGDNKNVAKKAAAKLALRLLDRI